jgi:serine O-acetyltransferase
VPAGATVVGVPGRIAGAKRAETTGADLEHARMPDPVLRTLAETLDQQGRLEERVRALERVLSYPAHPPEVTQTGPDGEAALWEALHSVIDPEIGASIVDLGMVRDISLNEHGVEVHIATCAGCSMEGYLIEQVRRKVKSVMGDSLVRVVILDEAWTWEDAVPSLIGGEGI